MGDSGRTSPKQSPLAAGAAAATASAAAVATVVTSEKSRRSAPSAVARPAAGAGAGAAATVRGVRRARPRRALRGGTGVRAGLRRPGRGMPVGRELVWGRVCAGARQRGGRQGHAGAAGVHSRGRKWRATARWWRVRGSPSPPTVGGQVSCEWHLGAAFRVDGHAPGASAQRRVSGGMCTRSNGRAWQPQRARCAHLVLITHDTHYLQLVNVRLGDGGRRRDGRSHWCPKRGQGTAATRAPAPKRHALGAAAAIHLPLTANGVACGAPAPFSAFSLPGGRAMAACSCVAWWSAGIMACVGEQGGSGGAARQTMQDKVGTRRQRATLAAGGEGSTAAGIDRLKTSKRAAAAAVAARLTNQNAAAACCMAAFTRCQSGSGSDSDAGAG